MNLKELGQLTEAGGRASKYGHKTQLFIELANVLNYKPLKWPKLPAEVLEAACNEVVARWNKHPSPRISKDTLSHIYYPYDSDMSLREKAKAMMGRLKDGGNLPHGFPMMDRYFDAIKTIAEVGDEAEAYGKLVYQLGIELFMVNGSISHEMMNEKQRTFARAAMENLGAEIRTRG